MTGALGTRGRAPVRTVVRTACGVLALALLAGAVSLAAPRLLRQGVSAALAHALGPGAAVTVTLGGGHPLEMLRGRFGPVRLRASGLRVGAVRLASLDVSARRLDISLNSLVLGRRLVISRAEGLRATAAITQGELNALLARRSRAAGVPLHLSLGSGAVRLTANLPLAGRTWPLVAEGRFVPAGTAGIALVIDRLWLDGFLAPVPVRNRVAARLGPDLPRIDLSGLPVSLSVQAVHVQPGLLVVDAVGAGPGPLGA